jgi:hypothetical protein
MKKSELKNIIKECVKEVIFEEGVLSGIIAEVAQGLGASPRLTETTAASSVQAPRTNAAKQEVLRAVAGQGYEDLKKRFSNPELFEGTSPIPTGKGSGPLSGQAHGDPGLDISALPGAGTWAAVAAGKKR